MAELVGREVKPAVMVKRRYTGVRGKTKLRPNRRGSGMVECEPGKIYDLTESQADQWSDRFEDPDLALKRAMDVDDSVDTDTEGGEEG